VSEGGLLITWTGMGEVTRALDDLCAAIKVDAEAALHWYGRMATSEMKSQHEADAHDIQRYVNRTWNLTRSIAYDVQRLSGETIRLRMYTPTWYAEPVEFGTPRSRAYPFFWPAVHGLEEAGRMRVIKAFLGALSAHESWVKAGGGQVRGMIMEVDFTVQEISEIGEGTRDFLT